MNYLDLLIYIAKNSSSLSMQSSTGRIADELIVSQQTISRKLRELEEKNLIERHVSPKGTGIKLTEEGKKFLENYYSMLNEIISGKQSKRINKINPVKGIIETGMGEGAYYIKEYRKKIKEKINMLPFPGTLNLKVDPEEYSEFINSLNPIKIDSFKTRERSFGPITLFRVKAKGIDSAIVIPERTSHKRDVMELIAPMNLRKKLRIKDGNKLVVFPV